MKLIAFTIFLLYSVNAQQAIETSFFDKGDSTCMDMPVFITRSQDISKRCSSSSQCTNGTRANCLQSISAAPLPTSGNYVMQELFDKKDQCSSSVAGMYAFKTDGCYKAGPKYFMAQCSVNGDAKVLMCDDDKCTKCPSSQKIVGKDGECVQDSFRLKCIKANAATSLIASNYATAFMVLVFALFAF